ncbi:hypothetical protein [Ottowia sp.]|uniref:hypothetical protein n=1 Tax=Ottowia sp. TaxID=1898956 RepID=UPI003A8A5A3D
MLDYLYVLLEANRIVFFLGMLLVVLLANEIGLRIGRRRRQDIGDGADEGATLVVGSLLGLMAFVLALNLSSATSRYELRMHATLEEANAIGTALLQADAAGGAQAETLVADLKRYLDVRYRYIRQPGLSKEIDDLNDETAALQNKIWIDVKQRVTEAPSPTTNSLMNAVNNAFDSSTTMRQAMEFRMPAQIIALLLGLSILGTAAVGYQFGLTKRKGRAPGIVLAILWCVIVTEIIDIGAARIWSFRTDARVYEWSLDSLGMPRATDGR